MGSTCRSAIGISRTCTFWAASARGESCAFAAGLGTALRAERARAEPAHFYWCWCLQLVPFRAGTGAKGGRAASVRLPLSPATPGLSVRLWVVLLEARVNQLHSGPERRPGAAGLRGGRTH